ncbi:hypothetical protein [Paludibaculum fermentans]|uniref:hypothetical protein n=1 Tax=Paludibaculum fermentans TaxID=1473598 RepID=UPI003EBB5B5D
MLMTGRMQKAGSVFHVGLDLGLRRNPTALALVEDVTRPTGEFDHVYYTDVMETALVLRNLQRLPLETPYAELPGYLERYLAGLAKRGTVHLAVDATGVGLAVVEMLQMAQLPAQLMPIVITSGESVGQLKHATSVPRSMLLQNMRMVLEKGGLRIPSRLRLLRELKRELRALGDPKSRTPDDMAFALALASWSARPQPTVGERSVALPVHLVGPKPRPLV